MSLTMGVEEEFSLYLNGEPVQVDLKDFRPSDGVSLAIENHVSILEIITPVHNSLPSLVENVTTNRLWLQKEAERLAFSFEACGVPTQFYWGKCGLRTTDDKYKKLLARYGACSSDIMTMGMHIHFGGIPEDHIPAVFNGTRRFIPFLIAMSANSKSTHHTGVNIASSRLFKSAIKPRTGIPNSMSNVNDYRTQLQRMLITQTVDSLTEQWHDIRFHPVHQTLEIRCFDTQSTSRDAVNMIKLAHEIVCNLIKDPNWLQHEFPDENWLLEENRWRAIRNGKNAELITHNDSVSSITSLLSLVSSSPELFI